MENLLTSLDLQRFRRIERCSKVFDDFGGDGVEIGKICAVFERLVLRQKMWRLSLSRLPNSL